MKTTAWDRRGANARGLAAAGGMALLAAAVLAGCRKAAPREEMFATMGTYASVIAGAEEHDRAGDYATVCRDIMETINAQLSLYRTNSELCRMNAQAGGEPFVVEEHLRANLEQALRFGRLSGGAFDVTVGPLVQLWGFSGGRKPARAIVPETLAEVRQRVGYDGIRLDGNEVQLDRPGMVVDLGGVAKGYAVDLCYEELLRRGARNFLVNLGGNMRGAGRPEHARPWTIGVRDPFQHGRIVGRMTLHDGMAVATSGNYEQYVEIEGKRYTHIIDPRTGYPVEGMAGVTVVATNAADADALSTTLFVLGMREGSRIVAGLPGCAAVFIPDRQPMEVWVTPRARALFEPGPGVEPRLLPAAP